MVSGGRRVDEHADRVEQRVPVATRRGRCARPSRRRGRPPRRRSPRRRTRGGRPCGRGRSGSAKRDPGKLELLAAFEQHLGPCGAKARLDPGPGCRRPAAPADRARAQACGRARRSPRRARRHLRCDRGRRASRGSRAHPAPASAACDALASRPASRDRRRPPRPHPAGGRRSSWTGTGPAEAARLRGPSEGESSRFRAAELSRRSDGH